MEIPQLRKKLIGGFVSLTFRKAILDAINFITIFIVLARILPIETIGIFGIASAVIGFFSYFSDIGLAGAIIQKKEITKVDLQTTFFIQESLALSIVIIIWIAAPFVANFYQFDDSSMWLIRALAVGFFLTSLKVIPTVLLERELHFNPIVWVDVLESIIFNGLLIFLTFQGYGVSAFTWAVVTRSLVGAVTINVISPWRMQLGYSKESAKQLLNFGVPFQLNSILALLKDRLTPLITARIIGTAGMGYVTWAQGIAYRPLEVMNIVIRVTFPAFAKLQDQRDELKSIIQRTIFLNGLFLYPLICGLLAIVPMFISVMGKEKFAPALPLFYLFAFSTFWSSISTIFTNVLTAIGKVGITLKLMVMWTVLTWLLSPLLALFYGYIGVALAAAIISVTSIIPIIIVIRMIKVDVVASIWRPLLAALIMALSVYAVSVTVEDTVGMLVVLIGLGVVIYCSALWLIAKKDLLETLREFRHEAS